MMPRSPDLAIFVMTTDDRRTKPIALPPCACARGNNSLYMFSELLRVKRRIKVTCTACFFGLIESSGELQIESSTDASWRRVYIITLKSYMN